MECRTFVLSKLKDDFGHEIDHSEKVAVEAGALAYVEGQRVSLRESSRREACLLAQIAGLLHDLRRGEKDHAKASAPVASRILQELSIFPKREEYIVQAIANHEAFIEPKRIDSPVGQMISDALYDADKFRWGPDNFTQTLWQMLRSSKAVSHS
jgi:HD superfamily phosphodiesterase